MSWSQGSYADSYPYIRQPVEHLSVFIQLQLQIVEDAENPFRGIFGPRRSEDHKHTVRPFYCSLGFGCEVEGYLHWAEPARWDQRHRQRAARPDVPIS